MTVALVGIVTQLISKLPGEITMMDMMDGMGWGMGLIGFLAILILVLGIAALVKYLLSGGSST
jgi:hypothetical protein